MTDPKQLAEKILGIVRNPETIHPSQYEMAQSLLREALEELKEDRERWADSAERLEKAQEKIRAYAFEEGKTEGLTRAAEVARQEYEKWRNEPHEFSLMLKSEQVANRMAAAIEKLKEGEL